MSVPAPASQLPSVLALQHELQQCRRARKFELASIPAFHLFHESELDSIGNSVIKEQRFKQLVSDTLKLCYLYEPIVQAHEQLVRPPFVSNTRQLEQYTLGQSSSQAGNCSFSIKALLQVLQESLFYRHMVRLKLDAQNSDMVINLVNNRPTELNKRVITAALMLYTGKKLTLQEIGTALLMFSLEEALVKLRPYGLPLQVPVLQKCMKKLERVISVGEVRSFITAARATADEQTRTSRKSQQVQYVMGPDQFLYLLAASQRKFVEDKLFFNIFGGRKKQGIDIFIEKAKNQASANQKNNSSTFQNSPSSHSHSHSHSLSHANVQQGNQVPTGKNKSVVGQKYTDTVPTQPQAHKESREKIRGLCLLGEDSPQMSNSNNQKMIYEQIKHYCQSRKQNPSALSRYKSTSHLCGQQDQTQKVNNNQGPVSKNQQNLARCKSVLLLTEMSKNVRPASALFKKSMKILDSTQNNILHAPPDEPQVQTACDTQQNPRRISQHMGPLDADFGQLYSQAARQIAQKQMQLPCYIPTNKGRSLSLCRNQCQQKVQIQVQQQQSQERGKSSSSEERVQYLYQKGRDSQRANINSYSSILNKGKSASVASFQRPGQHLKPMTKQARKMISWQKAEASREQLSKPRLITAQPPQPQPSWKSVSKYTDYRPNLGLLNKYETNLKTNILSRKLAKTKGKKLKLDQGGWEASSRLGSDMVAGQGDKFAGAGQREQALSINMVEENSCFFS